MRTGTGIINITNLFSLFYLFWALPLPAQWADWEQIIASEGENSALQDLFDNPIEINHASKEELLQLPWISEQKAERIISTRTRLNGFQSWQELIAEGLFSHTEIHFFQQIFTLSPARHTSLTLKGRHRLSFRNEKSKGELQHKFSGNRYRMYNRLDIRVGDHLQTGLVTEKDPGEASITDYITGVLDVSIPHLNSRCLVGQFTLENGTGLYTNSPYRYGYSDQPIHNAKPMQHRTRPFLATNENQGYRGIAVEVYRPAHLTAIFSQRNKAATLENNRITSFYNSGYYRSETEKEKKNKVKEKIIGLLLSYPFEQFMLSVGIRQTSTSLPLTYKKELEQIGSFAGSSRKSASVYLQGQKIPIFFEWTLTIGGGYALNGGCLWKQKSSQMILVYRHYQRGAVSELGSGLANRSENETGIYWGLLWHSRQKIKLSAFFDHSINTLPESRRPLLMPNTSWMGKIDYRINPVWAFACRYKNKVSYPLMSEKDPYGNRVVKSVTTRSDQWRIALDGTLTKSVLWRNKIEFHSSMINRDRFNAILMSQSFDLNVKPLRIIVHWTLYESPHYSTRFYHYSFSVPGSFALKTLYGRGAQTGLLLYIQPTAKFLLTLSALQTCYRDRAKHGSGLDEWLGESEHQFSFQIKWQL
jgi:hypothetical protein